MIGGIGVARYAALALLAGLALAVIGGCGGLDRADAPPTSIDLPAAWVVEVVGQAEAAWDAGLGPLRAGVEQIQDDLARNEPLEAYRLNWSIGRYNIRPQTARAALDSAFAQGIAQDLGYARSPTDGELVEEIIRPERAARLVQALFAKLRDDHPLLRGMLWPAIEASDQAIAKLYSGFLGAGGDWEAWRATLAPGEESKQRLGCTADAARCEVVQQYRPE